ncbi:MAG: hypothetical protein JWN86_727 [Planctomycetota bacterium]|nr:hypothetical protein [Planctomycetota bacterium]
MIYRFGPGRGHTVTAKGNAPVPVVIDEILDVDGVETVKLTVPPHAPGEVTLTRIFAVCALQPPGPSDTPQSYLDGPARYVGFADVAGDHTAAQALAIPVPNVPPGAWYFQTILQFDENTPPATAEAAPDAATPDAATTPA